MLHKIIKIISGLIFSSFAYVQLNDPDPVLWTVIYALVATLFFTSMFKQINRKVLILLLAVMGLYSLTIIPGFYTWLATPEKSELFGEMVYEKPYIEETREFLGLIIACAGLFYLLKKG